MPFIAPAIALAAEAFAVVGSFVTSLGVIGSGLIAGGIGIASGFLVSALSPKPNADSVQGGVNFERQYGTNVSRQVACGLVGIAGHDTYVNTFNPSNRTMQQIYTLSDYYSTALTRVAVGGVWVIIGADIGDGKGHQLMPTTAEQQWSGSIWVKFLDGRQTAADGFLTTFANPAGRWDASCIGKGITAVSILLEFDKDHNNSVPDFFFEFEGAPIYDWRKDSTNGGSGTHRWNDFTTHEYSANPILIERHYRRGFSVNGDLFCGMDMQESDLPVSKWTVAANVCDEIDVDDSLPRYQVSILLDCMVQHNSNLQSISLSCGSMQIDSVDGSWPLVGTDQPSVLTFTDDDLISIADSEFIRFKSMGELVNSVSGNYPEPEQLWSMIGYNDQIATAFLTIDRRTRDLAMDFPQVHLARQAAQLAFIYLYENRFEAKATVTLRPYFQTLEVGDWVDWNSAQYGLFTFIVTSKGLRSLESDGPRNAVLQLQQRDGGIYDGITPIPIVTPTANLGPVYLSEVQTFALAAVIVSGDLGRSAPAIRASWTPTIPVDVTITDIELIYYPTAQPTAILRKTVKADVSVAYLDGVVSNTNYTVQAKIITSPSRVTVFNAGATVTTSNVTIGFADIDTALTYNITTLQDLFKEDFEKFKAEISATVQEISSLQWLETKDVRSQLSSRSDAAFAEITHVQDVSTSTDGAMATDISNLYAGLDNIGTGTINLTALALSTLNHSFTQYQIDVTATFGSSFSKVSSVTSAINTINGYAAAQYSVTLDVNGYATGFNLFNGGGGISSTTFTTAHFQIAAPGVAGGAAIPMFDVGLVGGVPTIGARANMYLDGILTARMIAAIQVQAVHMAAQSITVANAALDNLVVKTFNIGDAAITAPDIGILASNFTGTGIGATIFNRSFTINSTGLGTSKFIYVSVDIYCPTIFSAVNINHATTLFINGTLVSSPSFISGQYFIVQGALKIPTTNSNQTINITFNWNSPNSGQLVAGSFSRTIAVIR